MRARLEVLIGALAFGASVPAGKVLLHDLPPLALAGGFYLSAGLFSAALLLVETRRRGTQSGRLHGSDWKWLGGAVVAGGILAPVALFYGLRSTSGYVAGLLLNLETVFTVALGAWLWKERVGPRGARGIALIVAGALLLSSAGGSGSGTTLLWGALLVVSACGLWGLDNTLTQRISLRDARSIVALKGLVGGTASLVLAASLGQLGTWSPPTIARVALVGIVSYGLSIVLFIRGLRELGVVMTGALFALAPAFAALLSWVFLHESVRPLSILALFGMTAGALLLSFDVHAHEHTHEALEHAHVHEHDEHHQHEHRPEDLAQEPHAHWHRHEPMTHSHPHAHDAHHRHSH